MNNKHLRTVQCASYTQTCSSNLARRVREFSEQTPPSMVYSSPTKGLSVLLPYNRGWQVIEVEALPETMTFTVEIQVANSSFKKLELISQKSSLRVYVNPDLGQPDEWEIPAGGGNMFLVSSPS